MLNQEREVLLGGDSFSLDHCACGMGRTEELEMAGEFLGSCSIALGELPLFPLLGSFCSPELARQRRSGKTLNYNFQRKGEGEVRESYQEALP